MLRITKNTDKLEIKNVICFFVGDEVPAKAEEVKKHKETDWSYQDYLTMSCAKHKYNLIWLHKRYVSYSFENDVININDEKTKVHISLNKDNIHDTIIFQGQANDEPGVNYIGLMRAFEYMEFYMLNTYDEIAMASDKIMSANLLSSKNIPQPRYVLVTKNIMQDDSTDDCFTRDSFWKLLDTLYDDNGNINDEQGERKYVVKILGGSLGIGVFICNHSEIEAILQAIFVIDEERELMIQQFKKNTGDIRAHAFSVDGKHYEVVAVMKRNQIKGDFRSNVSLGATTQEIDITDEQREIILNTAELSGCRWVGVDLMDCEDGDIVVIEYNSSPGVQGISQQIKKNMFDVVMDKITEYFKDGNKKEKDAQSAHRADIVKYFTGYDMDVVHALVEEWNTLSDKRKQLLTNCLSVKPGMQYTLHGKGPLYGFDCSGLIYWVAKSTLDIQLPKTCIDYLRIREDNPYESIKKNELIPGDIAIHNDSNQYNHCAIFMGIVNDMPVWFETNQAYGVQLSNYNDWKYFFRIKNIDAQ